MKVRPEYKFERKQWQRSSKFQWKDWFDKRKDSVKKSGLVEAEDYIAEGNQNQLSNSKIFKENWSKLNLW